MTKHQSFTVTLEEVTWRIADNCDRCGCHEDWWQVMGEDFSDAESAARFLAAHGRDLYRVTWPEHVIVPRFNSDARYQLQSEVGPTKEFEVIFLNNGDAVLQTGDGNYSAVFADITALAECVHLLMGGKSAQGWDGHDPVHRIDTDSEAFREAVRAGGYTHFDSHYLAASDIWDHAESSWGNVREFVLELWHCVKQAESDELCEEEVVFED